MEVVVVVVVTPSPHTWCNLIPNIFLPVMAFCTKLSPSITSPQNKHKPFKFKLSLSMYLLEKSDRYAFRYRSISLNLAQSRSTSINVDQHRSTIYINTYQSGSISVRLRGHSRRHSPFLAKPPLCLAVCVRYIGRVIANPRTNKRPNNRSEKPRRQQGLGQAVPGDGAAEHSRLIAEHVPVQLSFVVENCRRRPHRSIHVLLYQYRAVSGRLSGRWYGSLNCPLRFAKKNPKLSSK